MISKSKTRKSNKLLWQYFISYLILMLSVMIVLLTYAWHSFYQFHSRILMEKNLSAMELLRETNESELSQLVSMAGQFTSSPNISPFVYREEPEKAKRLIAQLSVYQASNGFIRGLYLRFYGDNFVFSATSSYLTENFLNRAALLERLTREEILYAFDNTRQMTIFGQQEVSGYLFSVQHGDRSTVVVPVFVPVVYSSGVGCATALYLVDKATYTQLFERIFTNEQDVYILSKDDVLVSQEVTGVPSGWVIQSALAAPDAQPISVTYEGQTYRLIQLPGSTMRPRYIMLVSDKELSVAMAGTVQVFVLVAAVVSALGLLLITRFVQSRMKPIRLIYDMLSDNAPTGNELLEIRDSVQRLIDSNSMLNTKMENVQTLRSADFARHFLHGGFVNEDEWLQKAEDIALNIDLRYFIVAIIAKPTDSDYDLAPQKLNHLFDEGVSGVSCALDMRDKAVLIAFSNEGQALYRWLEGKFEGMRACCVGMTMSASAAHTDYTEGALAYLEAENAFESRFVRGNTRVILFDTKTNERHNRTQNHQQAAERLRLALRDEDTEQVSAALEDISKVMGEMSLSLFAFRCMYNDILSVITSEARGKNPQNHDLYELFTLSQCLSLDDLDKMLRAACSKLISSKNHGKAQEDIPDEIALAMEIIQKRYTEPGFAVSAIAQELGMSDSKLSIDFKKAYQMTPLECLTMLRMRRARRLLGSTGMSVKDVAAECGYYEISGFNRRFKAYTGMTPQQYRQNCEDTKETGEA